MSDEERNNIFMEMFYRLLNQQLETYQKASQPIPQYPKGGFVNNGANITHSWMDESEFMIYATERDGYKDGIDLKKMNIGELYSYLHLSEDNERYELCVLIRDEINSRK